MHSPGYDYYGLLAATWDLWRDNTADWSDARFYYDIVQQYGEPVLDLGCGTGRILLDYLARGIDIEGLDNSPELLEICRAKAAKAGLSVRTYLQRIEEMNLPRRYRTILAPSSVLQLITDPGQFRIALKRIHDHLEPGGALVGSFAFEWHEGDPLESDWRLQFEKPRPEDGAIVRSWTYVRHDPENQLWHAHQRFEVEREGKVIEREEHERSPEGRWYTQAQARELFREAGFEPVKLYQEFTHEPAQPGARVFCALGVSS